MIYFFIICQSLTCPLWPRSGVSRAGQGCKDKKAPVKSTDCLRVHSGSKVTVEVNLQPGRLADRLVVFLSQPGEKLGASLVKEMKKGGVHEEHDKAST